MAKRTVAQFLQTFALPLVAGGEVHVGAPIAPKDLEQMSGELDKASLESTAVDDARESVLATCVSTPPRMLLEPDDLSLLAALHNALFLVHPRVESWVVTDRSKRKIVDASLTMASVPLTQNKARVLGRHALLHQLFDLWRRDITLSWWTGRAQFQGQRPPQRLLRWSDLRRVSQQEHPAPFAELLTGNDTAPIIATLVRRTPLTQLLRHAPGAPPLHWEDAVFALRDTEIARMLIYQLTTESDTDAGLSGLWRASAAFEQMLERTPPQKDVLAVAAALIYAEGLLCIDEAGRRSSKERSPQVAKALAVNDGGSRERGAATFFALSSAIATVAPHLSLPPGLAELPVALQRWKLRREQANALIGDGVLASLTARMQRHFSGISAGISAIAPTLP
jgi:hypothetical protein